MISKVSFRNFMVAMALTSSSVNAFNPVSPNKPSLPADASDALKAVTVDTEDNTALANINEGLEDVWGSVTQMIQSKMEEMGGEDSLSEEAQDEIITKALAAGVAGTVVGSPLVMGAALGFAGSQILQDDKKKEQLSQVGHDMMEQASAAIDFTKQELANEKDLNKVSAKILLALQDKAGELQQDLAAQASEKASEMQLSLVEKTSPSKLAEQIPGLVAGKIKDNVMQTVESEEFKTLPKKSFDKFVAFLESEEVQNMKAGAMQAVKDGLESDEVKALQSRATSAVQSGIDAASSKIKKP